MDDLFATLQVQPLGVWAYILLAVLVAVEGPVTTLAGAVASSAGYLNPLLVFVSASCGNLSADVIWYALGYAGKKEWLVHYGGRFGVKENVTSLVLPLGYSFNLDGSMVYQAFAGTVMILLRPIPMIGAVLVYYDLRIRKEGFDLWMMAEALGLPGPAGPAKPPASLSPLRLTSRGP